MNFLFSLEAVKSLSKFSNLVKLLRGASLLPECNELIAGPREVARPLRVPAALQGQPHPVGIMHFL